MLPFMNTGRKQLVMTHSLIYSLLSAADRSSSMSVHASRLV